MTKICPETGVDQQRFYMVAQEKHVFIQWPYSIHGNSLHDAPKLMWHVALSYEIPMKTGLSTISTD